MGNLAFAVMAGFALAIDTSTVPHRMAGTSQAMTNPLESQAVASAGRRRDRCSSHVMIETFTRFQPRPLRNAAR